MHYNEKKQVSSPRVPIIQEESGDVLSVIATARGRKEARDRKMGKEEKGEK